jgi:hypothetical protein
MEIALLRRALYVILVGSAVMYAVSLGLGGYSRAADDKIRVEAAKTRYFLGIVVSLAGLATSARPARLTGARRGPRRGG